MERTNTAPHVLVVDDDPGVLGALTSSLEDRGANVFMADDLKSARRAIRSRSFDLVLTDLCLEGGMEGLDVARAAKSASPSTKIVLFSGTDGHPSLEEARKVGVDEFVPKPFPPEILDRLVADIGEASEPRSHEPTSSNRRRLSDSEGQALLDQFVEGDRTAFNLIVDAYTPMLFGIFLKWFNLTVEDAEDLYQEVQLQLLVKAATIRNVRLWLVGAAVNQAKKRIRRLVRDRNLVSRYLEQAPSRNEPVQEPVDDIRELVQRGLDMLRPADQELLTLLYLEELSYKEAAERLDRPIGSIGPERGRALKRLMAAVASLERRPTTTGSVTIH